MGFFSSHVIDLPMKWKCFDTASWIIWPFFSARVSVVANLVVYGCIVMDFTLNVEVHRGWESCTNWSRNLPLMLSPQASGFFERCCCSVTSTPLMVVEMLFLSAAKPALTLFIASLTRASASSVFVWFLVWFARISSSHWGLDFEILWCGIFMEGDDDGHRADTSESRRKTWNNSLCWSLNLLIDNWVTQITSQILFSLDNTTSFSFPKRFYVPVLLLLKYDK